MGTPALAVPCLDALAGEHEIVVVVTQPDKPGRRGHAMISPPVKIRALELGLPVLQPGRARDADFVEQLAAFSPDAVAVVAYGQILPQSVLDLAPLGCVNLHFSLLPRWRGAAPVQYALWKGDRVTGVTTQFMVARLDAGDVIQQLEVPILEHETAAELLERLTPIGSATLLETLRLLETGTAPRVPQEESGVTLAPTIIREQAQLQWEQPAPVLENLVRAMNSWPVAWCLWNNEPLKVWRAQAASAEAETALGAPGQVLEVRGSELVVATGEGVLMLREVQAAGKGRMAAGDWARGARVERGARFTA